MHFSALHSAVPHPGRLLQQPNMSRIDQHIGLFLFYSPPNPKQKRPMYWNYLSGLPLGTSSPVRRTPPSYNGICAGIKAFIIHHVLPNQCCWVTPLVAVQTRKKAAADAWIHEAPRHGEPLYVPYILYITKFNCNQKYTELNVCHNLLL